MDIPRICIVGAGRLSTLKIYPYIASAGAKLVGVCTRSTESARHVTSLYGGNPYTDLGEMLHREKPDGVIICVGPAMHAAFARQVMQQKIPVYTEKPPALSASDALDVARVSQETGMLCSIGFKKRYNVAYSRAKRWLQSFDPADFYSLGIEYACRQYSNEDEQNSVLLDFGIHIIDLAGFLFGDAQEVFCFSKGMDAYAVSIKYANGSVGTINLNDGRSFEIPTEEVEISIKGGNFMTIHNSSCWKITESGETKEWREPPIFRSAGDSGHETGHFSELIDFLAAIKEGRTTRSNIWESYKSMVLYEAIRDSAKEGRIMKVSYHKID